MLSKAQISLITSLQHKKFRAQHNLFVVEGVKSVLEFVHSPYKVEKIFYTDDALTKLDKIPQNIKQENVSDNEFNKISSLKNPQGALALVQLPSTQDISVKQLKGAHHLVLDDVQDPGNLGTIIRTAEWFGISNILCSYNTVDAFNAKVVQASMGSLSRVNIHYVDIEEFLTDISLPTFGAFLQGDSIFQTDFGTEGLIVMGNEGNGIRENLKEKINHRITIPRIGQAESLNVAVATTIFCAELTRQRLL